MTQSARKGSAAIVLQAQAADNIQNIRFADVVESYINFYASGQSHTARAKRIDLKHFIDFLAKLNGFSSPKKLAVRHWDYSSVQRFVDEQLQRGEAPATVGRRFATIKHMGRVLAEKVAGFINPAKEVKAPRLELPVPKALSAQEIKKIRSIARLRLDEKSSFIRLRNQMLFNFLLDTGIRADEVRLLRMSQLDDKLDWIQNVRTKGRRYRNVYITSELRKDLRRYLKARDIELKRFFPARSRRLDSALPLFVSSYRADPLKPESFCMGPKTIWRAVHELSHETELHPHLLRHSFALDLLEHSNDVRLVSQALGHSDVRITMRYTQRKDQHLARALEGARQRSRGGS